MAIAVPLDRLIGRSGFLIINPRLAANVVLYCHNICSRKDQHANDDKTDFKHSHPR